MTKSMESNQEMSLDRSEWLQQDKTNEQIEERFFSLWLSENFVDALNSWDFDTAQQELENLCLTAAEEKELLSFLSEMQYLEQWNTEVINQAKEIISEQIAEHSDTIFKEYQERKYISEDWIEEYWSNSFKEENKAVLSYLKRTEDIDSELLENLEEITIMDLLDFADKSWEEMEEFAKTQLEEGENERMPDRKILRLNWYNFQSRVFRWSETDAFVSLINHLNNSWKEDPLRQRLERIKYMKSLWVSARDIENANLLSKKIDKSNVFEFLSDYNNKWVVDGNDRWIIFGQQLLDTLQDVENHIWQEELVKNISQIMSTGAKIGGYDLNAEQIDTKDDLVNVLQQNPEYKQLFLQQLQTFVGSGVELQRLLSRWSDAFQETEQLKSDVIKDALWVEASPEEIQDWFSQALDQKINELKQQKESLPPDQKDQLNKVLQFLEGNKQWILQSLSINNLNIVTSSVEDREWVGAGTSVALNDWWQLRFNIWIGIMDGNIWIVPWISAWESVEIGDSTQMSFVVWNALKVPFGAVSINSQVNKDTLKEAGFQEYDAHYTQRTWISFNFSPHWWWITAWVDTNRQEWIEQKAEQLNNIMYKVFEFTPWMSKEEYINSIKEWLENSEVEDKEYIQVIIDNLQYSLDYFDFDSLADQQKEILANRLMDSYVNKWQEQALLAAEQEWWKLSWMWITLQFIAWFLPIFWPTFNFENIKTEYEQNQDSKDLATLDLYTWQGILDSQWNISAEKIEKQLNIDWLKVSEKNWLLEFDIERDRNILDVLNVNILPWVMHQVQYEWWKLIVWDVWKITYTNRREQSWQSHHLVFGAEWTRWTVLLTKESAQWLTNNSPEMRIWKDSSEVINESIDQEYIKWVDKFISSNIEDFVSLAQSYEDEYEQLFKYYTQDYNLEKAFDAMGNLFEKAGIDTNLLNGIKERSEYEKVYVLAQFKDAMMTDWMTLDKWLDDTERKQKADKYLDKIFDWEDRISFGRHEFTKNFSQKMIHDLLNDPSKWEQQERIYNRTWDQLSYNYQEFLSFLMNYQEDQSIQNNYAKRLYNMFIPTWQLLNTKYFGQSNTNRSDSFETTLNRNSIDDSVMEKREELLNKIWDKNSFNSETRDDIIWFAHTAKLNSDWDRLVWWRGFDAIPAWVTNVVENEYVRIEEQTTKEQIVEMLKEENPIYWENMKESLGSYLNVDFTDENLETLLMEKRIDINWKNITLDSEFLFFLSWRCANESLWIRLWEIKIDWVWIWLVFNINWHAVSNEIEWARQTITWTHLHWEKEEEEKEEEEEEEDDDPTPTTRPTSSPTPPPRRGWWGWWGWWFNDF